MKVRTRKHRTMARLAANAKYRWRVQAIIRANEPRRIARIKRQALLDTLFPDLRGVPL
jgi:hypothetical protein